MSLNPSKRSRSQPQVKVTPKKSSAAEPDVKPKVWEHEIVTTLLVYRTIHNLSGQ